MHAFLAQCRILPCQLQHWLHSGAKQDLLQQPDGKRREGEVPEKGPNKTKGEGSEPADDAAKAVPRVQHALPQTELPLAVAALLRCRDCRRVCLLLQRAEAVSQRRRVCIPARREREKEGCDRKMRTQKSEWRIRGGNARNHTLEASL